MPSQALLFDIKTGEQPLPVMVFHEQEHRSRTQCAGQIGVGQEIAVMLMGME